MASSDNSVKRTCDEDVAKTTTTKKKKKRRSADYRITNVESCAEDDMDGKDAAKKEEREKVRKAVKFECEYILAPMVGASDLPFRLLCRKYGAQLAYTPMMSSSEFASSPSYRRRIFQTTEHDRPLVCHFSANDPTEFAAAARLVEEHCDAVDLNLGCPQRTAYLGHFGSYLLDPKDRLLIQNIVRAGCAAVSIPIFCKIRLLDTLQDTILLCRQLADAGATLIAIHARYRASFERTAAGARDGPAMLDQVLQIRKAVPHVLIVTNGNVQTYDHVVENLKFTGADGIMCAEALLDNPALFLPRLVHGESTVQKMKLESNTTSSSGNLVEYEKKRRKILKKLRKIKEIEDEKKRPSFVEGNLSEKEQKKLASKACLETKLAAIEKTIHRNNNNNNNKSVVLVSPLRELYDGARDEIQLANEYLELVRQYPVEIRSVVFHIRRMCKRYLTQFHLMEECISCQTMERIQTVLDQLIVYRNDPTLCSLERMVGKREQHVLEQKRINDDKRKIYEARMIRKAKREGLHDLHHYLRVGSKVPTTETIVQLTNCPNRRDQLSLWKEKQHSQHCMAFHLNQCTRDATACAFLHVPAIPNPNTTVFDEKDEIAG